MSKRRAALPLLLVASMLLLAACTRHTRYHGVVAMQAMTGDLRWDRSGSTAKGTLTLGGGSEESTGLPPGSYRVGLTFTADTFAGVVSDASGHEVAKTTGTVTATGVDLTLILPPPSIARFGITFKSTQPGAYTHSPDY